MSLKLSLDYFFAKKEGRREGRREGGRDREDVYFFLLFQTVI